MNATVALGQTKTHGASDLRRQLINHLRRLAKLEQLPSPPPPALLQNERRVLAMLEARLMDESTWK